MSDKIYTGFGSQVVVGPQNSSLLGGDKISDEDPASRWHNLRLQMRYFTVQAHVGDTNVTGKENISCKNSAENIGNVNDEKILVIEAKSCDSFHSCTSSMSNADPPKPPREKVRKSRHQFSMNKSSEEEFNNQITMINAIFLNKPPLKQPVKQAPKQCEIKTESCFSKRKHSNFLIADKKCNFESDHSSRVKILKASTNFKSTPFQKSTENVGSLYNGKEQRERLGTNETKTSQEKLSANKTMFKTFRINHKSIYSAKKPYMSRIIRRRNHQPVPHKLHNSKRLQIKCDNNVEPNEETVFSPENENEIHKGVLLDVKQGINEGYEINIHEPILQTGYSVAFISENTQDNLSGEEIQNDNEIHLVNLPDKNCEIVSSLDDFEESLLKLFVKLQNSDSNNQPSKGAIGTDSAIESNIKDYNKDENKTTEYENQLNLQCGPMSDQESNPDETSEKINCNEFLPYESEIKLSDLSLNETFELLFENESYWIENADNYSCPVTLEETLGEEKTPNESGSGGAEKQTEGSIILTEKPTGNIKKSNSIAYAKRRRSSTMKSFLPVIEESPEPAQDHTQDILNDYCLVDSLGRSIHLFDSRGFPLTDGSGRPLRSAGGQLLLKCDDNGIPVVDEETKIFDIFGRQPHEEGFQPWLSPQGSGANRLTMEDGRPLVLFDVEGKPLTSISGTMLVDSLGRSLLKLRNCFVR